ncbi:MAG TPA: hypothetical protein VGQ08_09075 [Nitrospiraceae bacterium]|jgi:hypothetical protein|nr:hypothetical protein [Nitrospiraceae bacterium]
MASKSSAGITLHQAAGIQNVFVKDWKLHFFDTPMKRIASIPFLRNLIEFTRGPLDANFIKLTSLLHWKADSAQITQSELDVIYNHLFATTEASPDGTSPVITQIRKEANDCLTAPDGINFENKIVLAVAIRLVAEEFMVKKINDPSYVAGLDSNQTPRLLTKFREKFPAELAAIGTIQRVILMTPENIHLNSFMYEPILDMSDEHLRKLYREVLALS